ncbi:MAG: sigma-E processing peptidase SpoIIGA [Clostridia bacterium]|nr:sigma-E processing peptidase SpoIIGA [Clostridia bacterium]
MQTIYIDILICVNLVINYLLLSATSFYTHTQLSVKRIIIGSAVGAVCSLCILLPVLPVAADMLLKILVSIMTVYSAFGYKKKKAFIKIYAVFILSTFIFGGIVAALWFLFSPQNLFIKNSIVYIELSPVLLIIYSVLCYIIFKGIYYLTGNYDTADSYCILTVFNSGNALRVNAKIDTGNSLKEPFSQAPVIVIGRNTAQSITPVEITEYETVTTLKFRESINNIRFIPFTTVGGRGIMPCFKAEKICINDDPCNKSVYIALCRDDYIQGDFQAIIPCEILD